jgi:hypothetical protein
VSPITIGTKGRRPAPGVGSIDMDHVLAILAGRYLDWGVISISVTNAAIIVAMVIIFVLALVVPFPRDHDDDSRGRRP